MPQPQTEEIDLRKVIESTKNMLALFGETNFTLSVHPQDNLTTWKLQRLDCRKLGKMRVEFRKKVQDGDRTFSLHSTQNGYLTTVTLPPGGIAILTKEQCAPGDNVIIVCERQSFYPAPAKFIESMDIETPKASEGTIVWNIRDHILLYHGGRFWTPC